MRIITPGAVTALTSKHRRRSLARRINDFTLWAFNAQPELSSRYDREA